MELYNSYYVETVAGTAANDASAHPYFKPRAVEVTSVAEPEKITQNPPEEIKVARYMHGGWEIHVPATGSTGLNIKITQFITSVSKENRDEYPDAGFVPFHRVAEQVAQYESTANYGCLECHDKLNFAANGNELTWSRSCGPSGRGEIHHLHRVAALAA